MNQMLTWLALGDSYTIGEACPIHESFPYQAVQLLRKEGININAPEILARTGWTTSELADQLNQTTLAADYGIVTLLIGVNNQYRGLSSSQYALEFEELLESAIRIAGNVPRHVFVLSIPNWALTPYAIERDVSAISKEVGLFNSINRKISLLHHVNYIDITTGSPETSANPGFLAPDGLHPSGRAYARWAKLLTDNILLVLSLRDSNPKA
jgi:lysophospholipase L1-like esterase